MPILGPISLVDCFVFVVFLVPQLFIQAGLYDVVLVVVKVLPFLCTRQHFPEHDQ